MIAADEYMSTVIAATKPTVIAYAELFIRRNDRATNVWSLYSFEAKLNELAQRRRLQVVKVSEGEARAYLCGRGVPRKSALAKAAVQTRLREMGWRYSDDHSADALCVANYAMRIVDDAWSADTFSLQPKGF